MELWQILVGLIQGLVEWLPISSEGQAVLFLYNFTSINPNELITLVIWLHLGTALAVIVRYPRDIFRIISLKDKYLFKLLLVATVCTAVTAVPLYFLVIESFSEFNGEVVNVLVGGLLLVTAVLLYMPSKTQEEKDPREAAMTTKEPDIKQAAITGLVQGFSILPGLSRSGVTVSALLMQKVDKETALRFSFLMSVPAVLGILVLEILSGASLPSTVGVLDLVGIEIIVFITGFASMEFLLRLARRVQFWKLCVILAIIAIVFGLPAFL